MGKLKPCPFCGGEAQIVRYTIDNICFVRCKHCGSETSFLELEDEAIEAWNKRSETSDGAEWVSVKDRLPKEEGKYLTVRPSWIKGGDPVLDICFFSECLEKVDEDEFKGRKYAGFYEYDDDWGYMARETVTHWMPLPDAPEEE